MKTMSSGLSPEYGTLVGVMWLGFTLFDSAHAEIARRAVVEAAFCNMDGGVDGLLAQV